MIFLSVVVPILELLLSIGAGVIANYICKWLDGKK